MSNEKDTLSPGGDLVVIGASAGGVEALSTLVSTLPLDFPAPVVLAQHLDPHRQSTLDHILQRRTALPITVVTSNSKLEAGNIYVIPSNRYVLVKDHYVEVQVDHVSRPLPSIDALLSSAAEIYGDRLIAVVLTGSGSDGAIGAVDVKNAGGTIIVQNPRTARYPSMPLALPPTIVDFEVEIEKIGPLLYNLLIGVATVQSSEEHTEDDLQNILELIHHQANVDFRQYKTSTILRRIGRRIAVTHTHTIQEYADYLRGSPEEVGELVKAFLINVTQFFRDPEAFAYIQDEILPKLIAKARTHDKVLRLWTAGCATGEEPYSLAMLLSDMLGSEMPGWSIKIFATDLDDAAIAFARHGIYSENLLKEVPDDYRNRFFERVDSGYRIAKILRQMVIFGQQDLSRSAPFPRIDLVLCRNVLIYFAPELQDYVLNQFAFSLSPDGYLFLGKAETVRPTQSYLSLVNKQWKVYHCTGNVLPSTRRQNLPKPSTKYVEGHVASPSNKGLSIPYEQESSQANSDFGQFRHFNELMLRFLPIGVVVIDRHYRVLTTNGSARRLLGLRDITGEQDFLHTVRGIPYATTRDAIDTVFRERSAVTLAEIELDATTSGNGRFLSLSIAPMQIDINKSDFAVISISDVTEQVQIRRQLESAQAEQFQLMSELGTANKRLSNVNKELMDANEELQVANEELMLTHEELQASIEEFETTNEELQATNEELETNNEELQATNEELETTNDELRARTSELQEMATTLDSERVRLTEIVELAPLYILVLRGPNLIIDVYNSNYDNIFEGLGAQDQPLSEVVELFLDKRLGMTLLQTAHEVYQQDERRTIPRMLTTSPEQQDGTKESYFVYTLLPSHDAHGHVNGVIVYARDETEQRAREGREEWTQLRLIFDNTPSALLALYDATTTHLLIASPSYLHTLNRLTGTQLDKSIGSKWLDTTIITPSEQANALWQMVQENSAPMRLPELAYTFAQDSQETFWDYSLTPIVDSNGDTLRFILVSMTDVTEQVLARRELERLDNIKDDFMSLTTHELRTPLTAILGNAQILQRGMKRMAAQVDDKDSQRKQLEQWVSMLDRIVNQTNKINSMLGEMTDVTRLSGEVFELHTTENVDIVEFIRRVIEQHTMIDAGKHAITFTPNTDVTLSTIDAARIEQVLNNLISNALKYSPAGKPVEVSISVVEDTPDTVTVAVCDEGYGINEEEQQHIFDRFYRASSREKADGLGLGLYIAYQIVVQHGGRMWLESKPGEGSTFYFTLPLSQHATEE